MPGVNSLSPAMRSRLLPLQLLSLMLPMLASGIVDSGTGQLALTCAGDLSIVAGVKKFVLLSANASSCRLSVPLAAGRWYVTLSVAVSDVTDGDLFLHDPAASGAGADNVTWSGPSQLSSDALSRLMTRGGAFDLSVALRRGRLNVTAVLVGPDACPPGWWSPWSSGCLFVSAFTTAMAFGDAQRACQRVGANLYTTSGSDATAWALTFLFYANGLHSGSAYWVGGRLVGGDWTYINGSRLADSDLQPYKYDCTVSSLACQCAVYREAKFYRSACADQRPFVCSAPPGGTLEFYSADGVPCRDCRGVTPAPADVDTTDDHQYYLYVLGICAFILAVITAAVVACFVDSVRRWQLDAKLAARRPPAYERRTSLRMEAAHHGDLDSEPPVYEDIFTGPASPANQEPSRLASPANQEPSRLASPANQEPSRLASPTNWDAATVQPPAVRIPSAALEAS